MTQTRHDVYLDELVYRLDHVGEDLKSVHWIMKDGIWQQENSVSRKSLCDLIVVYYDGCAVPIELKGSQAKKFKAVSQVKAGVNFIENVLGLRCNYGRIVYYSRDGYVSEKLNRCLL